MFCGLKTESKSCVFTFGKQRLSAAFLGLANKLKWGRLVLGPEGRVLHF